jgi:CBS domain-containing protein
MGRVTIREVGMPTVRDVLARKSPDHRATVTADPSATVLDAVRRMVEHGIGGLPVVERDAIVGIFTERDLLRRVVGEGRDPAATPVHDVMTSPVLVCRPETPIEECAALMTNRRLRHLPVIGDGGLVGMLTIGDVMAYEVDEQRSTIQELNKYIYALH